MKFHFCTNDKWYSKAASFIGREPHTHIGIEFFDGDLDLVLDCTKPHSKLYHMDHWVTKYDILDSLELILSEREEKQIYKHAVRVCLNKPYDWHSYYYLWFLGIRRFLFNTPFPKRNKFNGPGLICTEIMEPVKHDIFNLTQLDLYDYDFSIVTPTQIYNILKEHPQFKEVPIESKKT